MLGQLHRRASGVRVFSRPVHPTLAAPRFGAPLLDLCTYPLGHRTVRCASLSALPSLESSALRLHSADQSGGGIRTHDLRERYPAGFPLPYPALMARRSQAWVGAGTTARNVRARFDQRRMVQCESIKAGEARPRLSAKSFVPSGRSAMIRPATTASRRLPAVPAQSSRQLDHPCRGLSPNPNYL